ncbi:MAG: HD domain protein [Alphaproteobacteria bacterium ADurb.Bin438]|nr:MAG: HD domain protein [Alphaproteobacteria bacterium ADurb.Bin438]
MKKYEKILERYYNEQIATAKDEMEIEFINRKLTHSKSVLADGEELMELIKEFKESDDKKLIEYSKIALLLHDVGRFYQFNDGKYDIKMDHGLLGAKLLKEQEGIDAPEIYHAIKVHDKMGLDDMLNDPEYIALDDYKKNRTYLIAKLVKDADMYSNLKLRTEVGIVTATKMVDELFFTPEVLEAFDEGRLANKEFVKSILDVYVSIFAWSSAFNYKETRKLIRENEVFLKFADKYKEYVSLKDANKEDNKTLVKEALSKLDHIITSLKVRDYV